MKWAKGAPNKPGIYWIEFEDKRIELCEIFKEYGDDELVIVGIYWHGPNQLDALKPKIKSFYGPITSPEDSD